MYLVALFLFFLFLHVDANELEKASSPYLRQHKDNPVLWHEWSKQSFDLARRLDKPVFLSIGYSTCHWCHVMERDSYSDEKVAALLNRYFIPIKVDKEELPFIDIYFQRLFLHAKGHYGGWPLHVVLTPNKKAFFMTGYIPKREFFSLLPKLHQLYKNKKKLALAEESYFVEKKESTLSTSLEKKALLHSLEDSFKEEYDDLNGGFGDAPKFLQPQKMLLLMDVAKALQSEELNEMLYETLDAEALRGIYDSVEGGWFRYSVDASWEIPHFEKMLYTQAEMILLYAKAYKKSKKPLYKKVVVESVAMLKRHFFLENGGYASALDAESETKEGGYYLFSLDEMQNAVAKCEDKNSIKAALGASEWPNFHSMVHVSLNGRKRPACWRRVQKALFAFRMQKKPPFRDEKVNTVYNAMLAEALYEAGSIDEVYKKRADAIVSMIARKLFDKGRLYHYVIGNRRPQLNEMLEDYAFYIAALLKRYRLTLDPKDLSFAHYLLLHAKDTFFKSGVLLLSNATFAVKAKSEDKYYTSAYGKYVQDLMCYCELTHDEKVCRFAKKLLRLQRPNHNTPALTRAFLQMH